MQRKTRFYRLDPFVDSDGILRVGGRLRRAELHERVHHHGWSITRGYWLVGGHHIVYKEILACVTSSKLRGRPLEQQMADLPADRMEVCASFTNVGFDVFGPWDVHTRKTRGGSANSKRWGIVFTCLASRAIQIELLESMATSAFICALRRFFALRGEAALLCCNRVYHHHHHHHHINVLGGKLELEEAFEEMDLGEVSRFGAEQGRKWELNPPHVSHFGGVGERQIGTIRRVLGGMFAEPGKTQLTHEFLITLMAEVTGIVNARPLTGIPGDVDDPQPLSPAALITMKTRPLGPPPGTFPPPIYMLFDVETSSVSRRLILGEVASRVPSVPTTTEEVDQPQRDLIEGDIVLMKEEGEYVNEWPMGRVTDALNVPLLETARRKSCCVPSRN